MVKHLGPRNAVVTAKNKTQRIVQSRRKSQGVESYDFTDVNAEAAPAKSNSIDFSTLPKRK